MRKLLPAALVVVLAPLLIAFLMSKPPSIQIDPAVKTIGMATPVKVRVESPHGVRQISAYLQQNGTRYKVFEETQPARWNPFRGGEAAREWTIPAGKQQASALQEGKAALVVEAKANDFAARADSKSIPVDVITQPPMVSADGAQHYINQGGAELVTFTASGYWT
jgi:hypothetical protein